LIAYSIEKRGRNRIDDDEREKGENDLDNIKFEKAKVVKMVKT